MMNGTFFCEKNTSSSIYQHYCGVNNNTGDACEYYNKNEVLKLKGIPGLASGKFIGKFIFIETFFIFVDATLAVLGSGL